MQHVICIKWSADNKYILSGSDEMNIRLWKANAAEKLGVVSPAASFLLSPPSAASCWSAGSVGLCFCLLSADATWNRLATGDLWTRKIHCSCLTNPQQKDFYRSGLVRVWEDSEVSSEGFHTNPSSLQSKWGSLLILVIFLTGLQSGKSTCFCCLWKTIRKLFTLKRSDRSCSYQQFESANHLKQATLGHNEAPRIKLYWGGL